MTDFSGRLAPDGGRKSRASQLRPATFLLIPLAAILFQVYIPRFLEPLAYLDLPLLVTVYFALLQRGPVAALLFGAGIGLAQDSLSHQPLGMFGLVKTLVGYFSATVSQKFDVDNVAVRFILAFFFYVFHQFFSWVLMRALLGLSGDFAPQREVIVGLLNAAVALPLFHILDRLMVRN